MVIERLYILDVQKVSGCTQRKICALGLTKILTEVKQMAPSGEFAHLWYFPIACSETLIHMF